MSRILFPVDYSGQCTAAAPHVAAFARILGADVVLLHTVAPADCLHLAPEMYAASVADLTRWQKDADRKRLEGFLPELFAGAIRVIGTGDAAHDIVEYAHSEPVGLIMLPTHGMGPFRRFLIGSVAAKVLHDAHVPIWTSEHAEQKRAAPDRYRAILCACDLSPKTVESLRWAADFAARSGGSLHVVHAVPAAEARPERYFDTELVAVLASEARERIGKLLAENGLAAAAIHTRGGSPDRVIHEVAAETAADLLVIGRGAVAAGLGRLRAHGYSIIGNSPCPVVSV